MVRSKTDRTRRFIYHNFLDVMRILFWKCLLLVFAGNVFGQTVTFTVRVYDEVHDVPLSLARVELRRGEIVVARRITNPAGIAVFNDVAEGSYVVTIRYVSYTTFTDSVLIDSAHVWLDAKLVEEEHQDVIVVADGMPQITAVDIQTGNQVFEAETYHAAPSSRITSLIQQNLAGAARATTGEVHIRGQHGEFTYLVDGIPVPLGVFGGLNEVVDPKVIDRAVFHTGGFAAEYGGQMAGIVDLQNRVPSGHFHLDAETYVGSYLTDDNAGDNIGAFKAINSNGASLAVSDHLDAFGYFVSASRQETDRRIDPPLEYLSHDHGFDYFLYGKFDYLLSDRDYLTLNLNWGRTYTQIPFDSLEQGIVDDRQKTTNAFQGLSYFHTISTEPDGQSDLFAGIYSRQGALAFLPGAINEPFFYFASDTVTPYVLAEDRSFMTLGLRSKYTKRFSHELSMAAGLQIEAVTGKEHFTSRDSAGNSGPEIISDFKGSDFGAFLQAEWHPLEWTRFDLGVRYDQHIAPDVEVQRQLSPRIRWNFLIGEATNAYLYYGKLLMPTNIEGLRTLASNVGSLGEATLAERDDLYEAAFTHSFSFGMTGKFAYFHKLASPGLDDESLGSSAIRTPVNIETVTTDGLELALSYHHPTLPFSMLSNIAVIHAYGSGKISGGFLDIDEVGEASDLDHDQRLSVVLSANYQPKNWFVNVAANYGSGLTNGNPDNITFGTGLFDFNQRAHVTPAWIINLSGGYTFQLSGRTSLETSVYITNVFDHSHLLKGIYFSGAAWEERRNVIFKINWDF